MINAQERVKIWNAFLKNAWLESRKLYEITRKKECSKKFDVGATPELSEDAYHRLFAIIQCNLAIEARANHLIDELVEDDVITKDVGDAARWLPTRVKWFLIPTLAGKKNKLDSSSGPHQAIAQICDLRNEFIHVNYPSLKKSLPTAKTILSYFERFVEAMEDMNVVLGRHSEPNKDIINIGKFDNAQ
jgi:hypothetical protein